MSVIKKIKLNETIEIISSEDCDCFVQGYPGMENLA